MPLCRSHRLILAALTFVFTPAILCAEEKPEDVKLSVLTAAPLGVSPGVKSTVVLRGRKLDGAEQVATGEVSAEVKIIEKKASAAPTKELTKRLGDTELTLEITLPSDSTAAELPITITSPAGTSEAFFLPVSPTEKTIAEVEPNNGYAQAQLVEPGRIVLGSIHESKNVDVFAFEGKAGQKAIVELKAARVGSGLDSLVTLATKSGRIVASNDDSHGSRDSHVEATLPADGPYVIVVQDALDAGGAMYGYRLSVVLAD